MFKKIEIWILYLVILVSLLAALGFGILVRQELEGRVKVGVFSETALLLARSPRIIKDFLEHDAQVPDRFPDQRGFEGTGNDYESYLLLSRYDGDLQEGIVELVDLTTFEVLHVWNPDLEALNALVPKEGEFENLDINNAEWRDLLRHPLLLDDGSLVFKRESPLRKIDRCSNLVFQNTHDIYHHSVEKDAEGNLWVPGRLYPYHLPEAQVGTEEFKDDAIVKISPDGDVLFEKSVAEIFIENGLEYLVFAVGAQRFDEDPIHLNDIQPVDQDGRFWKKGDLFLSLRSQSMIVLYRPSTNEIVWKGVGPIFHQHDVDILDDAKIAIFNNNARDFVTGHTVDGHNEVIVYDFESGAFSRYLPDALIEEDVRTVTEGLSEILPNGDLLVEETNYGRTLFFNADGSLRWSHVNRASDDKVYRVGWSRILFSVEDISTVKSFLSEEVACEE